MESPLTIEALRRELGLNQAEFAQRLGLANKASVSLLERGGPCSLPVALRLEALSGGRIDAAALNEDVALARRPLATVDDQSDPGSWKDAIEHSPNMRVEDYPATAPAQDWQLSPEEVEALPGAQAAPAEADQVVICDVCEARLDRAVPRACTFVDCPHAVRNAA